MKIAEIVVKPKSFDAKYTVSIGYLTYVFGIDRFDCETGILPDFGKAISPKCDFICEICST
jgi:hypothetical protein